MKALQNSGREIERLGPIQVLEHELLMYSTHLACHASLNENALELYVLRFLLESVDQRKRIFALVEVFAEPLLGSILKINKYERSIYKG
jgi:hypothetical protein